jgi:tetratricopeptide (TPR) repeat protein
MKPTRDALNSIGKTVETIDAGRFDEVERSLSGMSPAEEPLVKILTVEVDVYFSRLGKVGELIEGVDAASLDARSLPRFFMASGSYHFARGEYDRAQQLFEAAYHNYKLLNERYYTAQGLYNLGRLKLVQGNVAEAEAALGDAKNLLSEEATAKSDYLLGLVEYNLGVCREQAGAQDAAKELYNSAIKLLKETECCRHFASAMTSLGGLLTSAGHYSEAIDLLKEAYAILSRYEISDELATTASKLSVALARTTDFDEAQRVLLESLELHERIGDVRATAVTLKSLAELYLERNDMARVEKYAKDALAQANAIGDPVLQAESNIVVGRVAARRRDHVQAEKALQAAQEIAKGLGYKKLEGQICLYLAEVYYSTSPVKAQEYVTRAQELLQGFRDPWIEQELQRVSQRSTTERVKLTADNKLVFDGNFLPNWYSAKEALEQFLLKNALRQSGGNLTKAGEILGITKVHVHNLRKQFGI